MKTIAIVTPVFNRANEIKKLYESLCQQTEKDFIWIIVDDGSTDNISTMVKMFEKNIDIRFIKQKNGGKCKALNSAAQVCECEWFFVVDSDDYLFPNSIQLILEEIKKIKNDESIVGIVANRCFSDYSICGKKFPEKKERIGYNELNYHYNQDGETALIYRTKYMKKYMHKVIDGENFLSEEIQYNEIDSEGDLWVLSKPLIIMEYLENGLTNNYFNLWLNNPKGTDLLLNSKYHAIKNLNIVDIIIKKVKVIVQFNIVFIKSKNCSLRDSPNLFASVIMLPFSILLAYTYKDFINR